MVFSTARFAQALAHRLGHAMSVSSRIMNSPTAATRRVTTGDD